MEKLQVTTFGTFSLTYGEITVSESDSHMRKIWMLIKYLAAHRDRAVPEYELIEIVGKKENVNNPSSVKTMLHRARNILSELSSGEGGSGDPKKLILHKNGAYLWNTDIPQTIDYDEFYKLIAEAELCDSPITKYAVESKALSIYQGYYLGKAFETNDLSAVIRDCHLTYIKLFESCAEYLFAVKDHRQIINNALAAILIDPYQETFHYNLIKAFINDGDHKNALFYYSKAADLFYGKYRINLSDRIRALYRHIIREDRPVQTSYPALKSDIWGAVTSGEASACEYDVFRFTCGALMKAPYAPEKTPYLLLLSAALKDEYTLPSQKQTANASERILEALRSCLGSGDIYTRCSAAQYAAVVFAGSEDVELLISRLIAKFNFLAPNSLFTLSIDCEPLSSADACI